MSYDMPLRLIRKLELEGAVNTHSSILHEINVVGRDLAEMGTGIHADMSSTDLEDTASYIEERLVALRRLIGRLRENEGLRELLT